MNTSSLGKVVYETKVTAQVYHHGTTQDNSALSCTATVLFTQM
jgi:hypothetical protein